MSTLDPKSALEFAKLHGIKTDEAAGSAKKDDTDIEHNKKDA